MVATTYIWGIADELSQKNLLVAVECVDNKTQQLIDLSLESKGFNFASFRHDFSSKASQKPPAQAFKPCKRKDGLEAKTNDELKAKKSG